MLGSAAVASAGGESVDWPIGGVGLITAAAAWVGKAGWLPFLVTMISLNSTTGWMSMTSEVVTVDVGSGRGGRGAKDLAAGCGGDMAVEAETGSG